jgi:hypothetical protein
MGLQRETALRNMQPSVLHCGVGCTGLLAVLELSELRLSTSQHCQPERTALPLSLALDLNVAETAGRDVLIDVSAGGSQCNPRAQLRQLTPAAGDQVPYQPLPLYLRPISQSRISSRSPAVDHKIMTERCSSRDIRRHGAQIPS